MSNIHWTLFFLSTIFEVICCSGIVEIRLLKFINSGGVGSNGHCCDGRGPFCFSDCDHKFKICIDSADGPDNLGSCPYYRRDSGEISNRNTITFGSSIGGIRNPIKILFDSWPGELKLKVEVWDVDDNSNDHVDFLSGTFGLKASRSESSAAVAAFQIRRRTLLTYNVKVYCDEFYYGEYCDVFCKPTDDEFGHFTCDSSTGIKMCMEGWYGEFCDQNDINECLSSPCNGSQTCVDTAHGYYCECPDGLQGPTCEESTNATCTSSTCENGGTCELVRGHVVCDCPHGFIGLKCEMTFDLCTEIQCENNGTCTIIMDNFHCKCADRYVGMFCEHELDMSGFPPSFNDTELFQMIENSTESISNLNISVNASVAFVETTTLGSYSSTPDVRASVQKETETTTQPVLTVRGRIDTHNREAVGKGIRDFLYEMMSVKKQLYLNLKYKVLTTNEGDMVSRIIVESAKDGDHSVNSTLIQHMFDETPLPVIEKYIQMPVVREEPIVGHSHEHINPHDHSFMHDKWYVVVIVVLIVVALIVAIGVLILYRHKKSKPENKEEVPRQNPGISEPTSSQSFENSLYFEMKRNNNKSEQNIEYTALP